MESNQVDLEVIKEKLCARFAPGMPAYLAVPDSWLPYLDKLDDELAAIDPNYRLAQVKKKFSGLRWYLGDSPAPACCADELFTDADPASEQRLIDHEHSLDHRLEEARREATTDWMMAVIARYEAASYDWA